MTRRQFWNRLAYLSSVWLLLAVLLGWLFVSHLVLDPVFNARTLREVQWSADSQAIYALYRQESSYNLHRFTLAGQPQRLYSQEGRFYQLTLSPDQTWMAFISYRPNNANLMGSPNQIIQLIELATGRMITLNRPPTITSNLHWQGDQLYFIQNEQGWVYNPRTGDLTQSDVEAITPPPASLDTISPDERWRTQFDCFDYSLQASDFGGDSDFACSAFEFSLLENDSNEEVWRISQNDLSDLYGIRLKYLTWMPLFTLLGVLIGPALLLPALWQRGSQSIARAGVVIIVLCYGLGLFLLIGAALR